uniref:Uncharacterized protein n=1 Tax=Kalanchoe fedtschenkoi TaxID=63787 RepID=A0A7N1A173_KALFE
MEWRSKSVPDSSRYSRAEFGQLDDDDGAKAYSFNGKADCGRLGSNPEEKRRKRVATYNMIGVEGKVKTCFRNSFKWIKNKFSDSAYNEPSNLRVTNPEYTEHDTGLAVEWSVEEQYTLEKTLDIYKNEPSIVRYIRIAAALPDKTVRDVAIRCRWMARKKRKQEEYYLEKRVTNRKEKSVESCPDRSLSSAQSFNMRTHSPLMHQFGQSGVAPSEASYDTVKHFLQQNLDAFDQISANISTYKFQENIELFCHARNNITTVLNEMRQLPGLPRFPISINEDLMNCLLPDISQVYFFVLTYFFLYVSLDLRRLYC